MAQDKEVVLDGSFKQQLTSDDIESFPTDTDALAVNDVVYIDSAGKAQKAQANSAAKEAIGIVIEKVDATNSKIITSGLLESFTTSMTPGTRYYLSAASAGVLTTTKPDGANFAQVVGIAASSTSLLVVPTAGQALTGYSFPLADGSADQVLTTDGSGLLSFANQSGGGGGGGISFDGSTANGILSYKDSDEATVEPYLTFDGSSLKLMSSADTGDYFTLTVGAAGTMVAATNDDDGTAANLTFDVDGTIYLDSYDYGYVILREHAQDYLRFERRATVGQNDAIIKNMEDGMDIIFQQYDGTETLRLTDAGNATIAADLTVTGDIILDDGGSIKEAGGTAAITIDGSGHVTKIGQDSPSSDEVLTWDGSKAVWSATAGGWSEAITKSIKLGTTDLGTELVTNGTFDSDASSWSLGTDWAYDSGKLTKSAGSGYTYSTITQTVSGVSSGTMYIVQFTTSNITTASAVILKLGTVGPSTSPAYVGVDGANTYTQLVKAGGTSLSLQSIGADAAFSIDSISVKEVYTPADGQVALWSSQELDGTESSLHITSEDGTTHTFGETVAINSFNNQGGGIFSVHSRNDGDNFITFHNDRHGFVDWALHNDGNNLVIQQAPYGSPIDVMTFVYNAYTPKVGIGTTSPTEVLDIDADAIRLRDSQTPASATATGTAGMICWDTNYVYVCVATNTWKRSALSTW